MTQIVDEILKMPNAFSYHSELTSKLMAEKEKRQKFYQDIDESVKAEFINGEIILHSPAMRRHNKVSFLLMSIFSAYNSYQDLGEFAVEKAMISLTRNDYEPDICFFRKEVANTFTDDQTHYPRPDFIVEILSKSTEKIDRNVKFIDYQQHGVQEYWIVNPEHKFLEQYILRNGEYDLNLKAKSGNIICDVIKGLHFNIEAVFDDVENKKALKILNSQ